MFLFKLIVRNSLRHKLRTALTMLAVTVAVLAFGMLRTMVDAWYAGVDAAAANRLITRNAISLNFFLPLSYKEKIRQVEGVSGVSCGNWFGGIYIDEKNFFANFAMDMKSFLGLYPEFMIAEQQRKALLTDRKGAVVGEKLARRFGWKIGDTVSLRGTIFPGTWEFTIRAIYKGRDKNTDETQFIFHWDYLNEKLKAMNITKAADSIGWYIVAITKPELAAEVSQRIDKLFKNSMAETFTETEKAFQMSFVSMTEAILSAVQMVSFLVIFIILAVVSNTMAMTVRERIREYTVFRSLGFEPLYIFMMIAGESLFITTAGGVLAIACTFPVVKEFGDYMSAYLPVFIVSPQTILLDAVISVAVGLLACIIPLWYTLKIKIADGLRAVA
ncbi:ABC transporter permease [Candidatus Magnetominusculus xianensis]|uniref:ABC transporter ATP-binding protein n=1 Tax=Candidatus Magnetominusculus xianensis TaxID=1748249 RepID=A0ABR5SF03_9BACT|nr:ABC transporter permease [Candidatus Magnetominusculus xianensis]KWT82588.1 ABC transporter ATP-binding protein [Candidatus Magnetominusculus xianensis]MBF0405164.1 ABC transporter permease [Nitrospirota bacterium]